LDLKLRKFPPVLLLSSFSHQARDAG